MSLLREYIRKELLLERQSFFNDVTNYIGSRDYDDVMDDVFKRLAPNLVRHVLEREVNEDMAEFLDGAVEGRFEKLGGWASLDPSPKEVGHSAASTDYVLGYTWGWDNAKTWDGKQLPSDARKEAVEMQIEEFEDQVSEQMVIAALEAANEKVNPVKLLRKAKDAIWHAVEKEGISGGLKKGLPIAVGIVAGETLDNFVIPMAFYAITGIPIPPLPVGVGEIINPIIISLVGSDTGEEELADELSWYEDEYGEASSLGPRPVSELRKYVRHLLAEAAKGVDDLVTNDVYVTISKDVDDVIVYYSDRSGKKNYLESDGIVGEVGIVKSSEMGSGDCSGSWQVDYAEAPKGWGPLLYDVAIEYATLNGAGLASDRVGVSEEARRVWDYYMNNRPDVQSHQLDKLVSEPLPGPQLTPDTTDDDCKQASSSRDKTSGKWFESSSSKRYTKEPATINALRAAGRLIEK